MKPFRSIRHPIAVDAGLGILDQEEEYARHVEQMIRQVLLTTPGERLNRPDFGCGVRRMVFAPNSKVTATLAQAQIYDSLNKWLGSVLVAGDVKVEAREEVLSIWIAYTIRARKERRYLNLEVTL
jgi:hypothetical protein